MSISLLSRLFHCRSNKKLIEVIEEEHYKDGDDQLIEEAAEVLSSIAVGNMFAIAEVVRLMVENEESLDFVLSSTLEDICVSNDEMITSELLIEIEANRNEEVTEAMTNALARSGIKNKKILVELVRILGESRKSEGDRIYSEYHESISEILKKIGVEDNDMTELLVIELRRFLRHSEAYKLLTNCSNAMKYKDFNRAFRRGFYRQIVSAVSPRTWILFAQRVRGWQKEFMT